MKKETVTDILLSKEKLTSYVTKETVTDILRSKEKLTSYVTKETVTDIRRSKDKLTRYAMKFDMAPIKDRKVPFIGEGIQKILMVESWRKRIINGTCNSVQ